MFLSYQFNSTNNTNFEVFVSCFEANICKFIDCAFVDQETAYGSCQ